MILGSRGHLLLGGCNPFTTPPIGAYQTVDAAAEALGVTDAGEILEENHYGGAALGDMATYVAVVGGANAHEELSKSLVADGYTLDADLENQSRWSGISAGKAIQIILRDLPEGGSVGLGDRDFSTDEPSAAIYVQSSE